LLGKGEHFCGKKRSPPPFTVPRRSKKITGEKKSYGGGGVLFLGKNHAQAI